MAQPHADDSAVIVRDFALANRPTPLYPFPTPTPVRTETPCPVDDDDIGRPLRRTAPPLLGVHTATESSSDLDPHSSDSDLVSSPIALDANPPKPSDGAPLRRSQRHGEIAGLVAAAGASSDAYDSDDGLAFTVPRRAKTSNSAEARGPIVNRPRSTSPRPCQPDDHVAGLAAPTSPSSDAVESDVGFSFTVRRRTRTRTAPASSNVSPSHLQVPGRNADLPPREPYGRTSDCTDSPSPPPRDRVPTTGELDKMWASKSSLARPNPRRASSPVVSKTTASATITKVGDPSSTGPSSGQASSGGTRADSSAGQSIDRPRCDSRSSPTPSSTSSSSSASRSWSSNDSIPSEVDLVFFCRRILKVQPGSDTDHTFEEGFETPRHGPTTVATVPDRQRIFSPLSWEYGFDEDDWASARMADLDDQACLDKDPGHQHQQDQKRPGRVLDDENVPPANPDDISVQWKRAALAKEERKRSAGRAVLI